MNSAHSPLCTLLQGFPHLLAFVVQHSTSFKLRDQEQSLVLSMSHGPFLTTTRHAVALLRTALTMSSITFLISDKEGGFIFSSQFEGAVLHGKKACWGVHFLWWWWWWQEAVWLTLQRTRKRRRWGAAVTHKWLTLQRTRKQRWGVLSPTRRSHSFPLVAYLNHDVARLSLRLGSPPPRHG